MNKAKHTYQLGEAKFSLTHADPDFESVLDRLLPHCHGENSYEAKALEIQMGLSFDIAELLRQVIAQHERCLLIQSACLVSPNGHQVLITGAPGSGKTTMAVALSLRYGWRVVSEDMTIINTEKNKIVSFAAPFNLSPGIRKILAASGVSLPGFILREWYPLAAHVAEPTCDARFDVSVHLDGEPTATELSCVRTSKSDQIRKIFPISNLLSVRGTDRFLECLPESFCYTFAGGSLSKRLEKTFELCSLSGSSEVDLPSNAN